MVENSELCFLDINIMSQRRNGGDWVDVLFTESLPFLRDIYMYIHLIEVRNCFVI